MRETMRATVPQPKATVINQSLPEDDLAGRPLPNHQIGPHDSSTTTQTANPTASQEKDMTLLNDKDQVNSPAIQQTVSSIPALNLSPFRQVLFIAVVCLAQFMA